MKTLKRILSVVATVALTVSLLVPLTVSAAPTGSITINLPDSVSLPKPKIATIADVPSQDLNAMGFEAYQVFKDVGDENNRIYEVHEDFKEFFDAIKPAAYDNNIRKDNTVWLMVNKSGNLEIIDKNDPKYNDESPNVIRISATIDSSSEDALAGLLVGLIDDSDARGSNAQLLATWLKGYAEKKKAEGEWPTQEALKATSTLDDSITISNLPIGYWLVYSTAKAPEGVSNVKVILYVGANKDATINAKAEYDGLQKMVKNLTDGTKSGEATQAGVGDILEYEVTFEIPPLGDYLYNNGTAVTGLHFNVLDTLTNQRLVKYTNNSTVVGGEDAFQGAFLLHIENTEMDNYYVDLESDTLSSTSNNVAAIKRSYGLTEDANLSALISVREKADGLSYGRYNEHTQTFYIHLDFNTLHDLPGVDANGAKVTLKYKAELTSDAVLRNGNIVTLDYSNDPSNNISKTEHKADTTVYSYGLDIKKTFEDDNTNGNTELWNKIEFKLYEATSEGEAPDDIAQGEAIKFVGDPGDYKRADSQDTGVDALRLKGANSKEDMEDGNTLKLYGLAPGYYILEETKTPSGYTLGGKVVIYVSSAGDVTLAETNYKLDKSKSHLWLDKKDIPNSSLDVGEEDNYQSLKFSIENKKRNVDLPETGGMGVWLCGIGGILVLAGAAYVYSSLRKKNII